MKILVTGAAGFIGSHLAERLCDLGHVVRGVDCLTDYYSRQLKELNVGQLRERGIQISPLDLSTGDLGALADDVEVIYHLAAQPGLSAAVNLDTYMTNNVVATQRLLEATLSSQSLLAFVNVSTSSVYGADATGDETSETRPTSYYGVSKLAAEQLALSYARDRGHPACSMRLFSVYGPRERPEKLYPRLIGSILSDQPFPLREGSETHQRSYTYVSDIVDGLVAAVDNVDKLAGEIFNIGSEVSISTTEGMGIVELIIGKSARIEKKPALPGDQQRTKANIDKARKVLGYAPKTSVRDGLKRTVDWYRQHIHGKIDLWPVA